MAHVIVITSKSNFATSTTSARQRGASGISLTGEILLIRLNRVDHALNPVLHHLGNMF